MYGGCCWKRTKFQRRWEVAVCCVFGKYPVQRQIHTSFLRTGFGDMRTYWRLRSKRTIFDKVREISILLFVTFFTVFVNLSPKGGIIRTHGGHVVWNCSPWFCCVVSLSIFTSCAVFWRARSESKYKQRVKFSAILHNKTSNKRFIIQHAKLLCPFERISRIFIYGECVTEVCEAERNWRGKSN